MANVSQTTPTVDVDSPEPDDSTLTSSSAYLPSAISSISNRHNYESVPMEEQDTSYQGAGERSLPKEESVHGLKINFEDHDANRLSLSPDSGRSPHLPDSSGGMLSPNSIRSKHQSFPSPQSPYPDDHSTTYSRSPASLYSTYTYDDNESTRRLRASTVTSIDPSRTLDELTCRTRRPIQTSRASWLSIIIIILSIYSTVFSAIFLGIAVAKPRYHRHITNNGPLLPSTASLLCQAFAKTIELTFVTTFVTALGQMLSHISMRKNSKGITLADMLLRQWIMQPGSIITHWEAVRYSALTVLGALTLFATLISMIYTTAADALVAPKLKYGGNDRRLLVGEVKTIFGNQSYQIDHCKTPVDTEDTPWDKGATCMEIEHSGQAYHNFMQYTPLWDTLNKTKPEGSSNMKERPPPIGMLWDNTTVIGSWVAEDDMPEKSKIHKRIINNVTLAMPHAAVVNAAKHKNNTILQPYDTNVSERP